LAASVDQTEAREDAGQAGTVETARPVQFRAAN
jgi:hypothetical protein